MNTQTQAVLDAALALPEEDRGILVDRLVDSLLTVQDPESDNELIDELERRRREIDDGSVKPIPWSEVKLDQ